jgi:SAM-dependent methyltransferase
MSTIITDDREQQVRDVWEGYWKDHGHAIPDWDTLSALILKRLEKEIGSLEGKTVCEAGCGSGRISQRLHEQGANVVCMDIADEALNLSRAVIGDSPRAKFLKGSILAIKERAVYDIVWNAGVLEHFRPDQQVVALDQFRLALKPGGRAIILTPFSRSLPYRFGKWWMERNQSWPYGPEVPVTTLKPVLPQGLMLKEEFTITFLPFFLDADKLVKKLKPLCSLARRFAQRFDPNTLRRIDRMFSAVFGGYLLVSIMERPGPKRVLPVLE